MNERINELVKQTDEWFDEDSHSYSRPLWNEKFAELIINECMTIAKNLEDQLENADSLSESNAVGIVAYRIARQFGVKE